MAIQVATVTLIIGQAWLKQANGERIPLTEGMTVSQGAEIVTGDGSTVRLEMADSDPIYIGSDREFLFGSDVIQSDVNAIDAAIHGLDSSTTGILARLLGTGEDLFTAIQSLNLLSDSDEGATGRADVYASDPAERSTDNLVHLLNLLETTGAIADRFARIAEPSRPLVSEFPHTVPNDGHLSSDRFDRQGPDNTAGTPGSSSVPDATPGIPFPTLTPAFASISVGTITGDNVLNLRESRDYVLVSGRVGGDAKAGDIVTLDVGGNAYQTVVAGDGSWSAHVPGSALEQQGSLHAAVTATNGSSSVTAAVSRDYGVDTNPPDVDIRIEQIDRVDSAGGVTASLAAVEPRYIVSGTLDYEAGADIAVTVQVNGRAYEAALDGDGHWSISVPASEFGYQGEVYAMATATDAAGNSASTSVTHDYALNTPPTATDGRILGVEDTPRVLAWDEFNVKDDSPSADQGILITGLPADGVLQFNAAAPGEAPAWTTIQLSDGRYEISRADIEAGRLRFVPDAHESGWDSSAGDAVGNNQADYAHITYRPSDGEFEGPAATLVVDIAPVADAPQMHFEVVSRDTIQALPEASYTLDGGIVITTADGAYTVSGLGTGQLMLPPFAANTGGNINPNDATQGQTDVIALIGDFNTLVVGRDGQAWQPLYGINGENRDYVFLSKSHDRYELTNATYNQGFLNGRLTDLDSGLSITLNNVKGLIYGDGHSSSNISIGYQETGQSHDEVTLSLHVGLLDTDGSETLSGVTLTGIPEGVAVEGAVSLPGGDWYIANPDGLQAMNLTLVLRVPEGTAPFAVTAQASSTEDGAATAATSSVTIEPGGGSGIDVSVAMAPVAGDGVINATEASAPTIALKGTITSEGGISIAVILTVNGHDYAATIDPQSGTWTADIATADLLADSMVVIRATSADAAGNSTTATTSHLYGIDIAAPELTIAVDPITADNLVNVAESGEPVDVSGAVSGEFNEGDVVTLTVGGTSLTGTVGADGTWTIAVAGSDLAAAGSLSVSVTTADAAGNSTTSTTTHSYGVDTTAPELAVSVDPITADNVINAAESGAATIAVSGTVGAEAGASTTVTITVNGQDYTATVDTTNGTWAVDVATDDLLADSAVAVSATSTDAAGNGTTATVSHDYSVDTTAPEVTVSVDPVTSDNVVNAAESGTSVDVTGTVTGEFNEGDVVTLTVGNTSLTGAAGADGTWTIAVPGSDLAGSSSLDVSV
ncbi:Ig-like domain-containing protein, partial [Castellaniella sp. GW247-6E4]|uniref:Ig-like domain-containing protein n=1 Tax=Castellaniella sp. GW247-6E4 TaxID=3140380 RepID=UPI003314E5D2